MGRGLHRRKDARARALIRRVTARAAKTWGPLGCAAMIAACAALVSPIQAASIVQVAPGAVLPGAGCTLQLSGDIAPGDTEQLDAIVAPIFAAYQNVHTHQIDGRVVLCLESPGGSFLEGLALAQFVNSRGIVTRVNPNGTCLSACAIVFMGGTAYIQDGLQPNRFLHPTSRLGFHAPDLIIPEGNFTREDVADAYQTAITAVALITSNAEVLDIRPRLLEAMLMHTGAEFHMVETIDHLAEYGILLYGYTAPRLTPETLRYACWNAVTWQMQHRPAATFEAYLQEVTRMRDMQNDLITFELYAEGAYCRIREPARPEGSALTFIDIARNEAMTLAPNTLQAPGWSRYPGPLPISEVFPGTMIDLLQLQ